jgi:hypothetical protein
LETKVATDLISAGESLPLKDGILSPPVSTWVWTAYINAERIPD